MMRRSSADRRAAESRNSDAALEELLGRATPRPSPPSADEAEVRAAIFAEWDGLTRNRVRRHRLLRVGLAASVLVTLFAGLTFLRAPGSDIYIEQVATIAKRAGEVRITGVDGGVRDAAASPSISNGERIVTGDSSGLALFWTRGGSLRIGQHSHIEVVSRTRIRLLAGRLYYDSVSDALADAVPIVGPARLLVETPQGILRHLGTQFAAELTDDGLSVSVREGRVRIESADARVFAEVGQRALLVAGRPIEYSAIGAADDYWQWAEQLSPPVLLDGRSVHDALMWISRESGREIRFQSEATEQAARERLIVGLDEYGRAEPSRALGGILSISGFDWSVEAGAIVIREPGDGGDGI